MRSAHIKPEDIFLGIIGGTPTSHVSVEFKELHHGEGVYLRTAGIGGVCTDSDYRKKGIATNVMRLALDYAMQKGLSNASLFTGTDLPARRIYQRFGFIDILTWRIYIRYLDYPSVFRKWILHFNRDIKESKIATRKLSGWEKSVVINLKEVGTLSFRVKGTRLQRLAKPPRRVNIQFSVDLETYAKILRGVVQWENAVSEGKLRVERGDQQDIEMLKRILNWRWDD